LYARDYLLRLGSRRGLTYQQQENRLYRGKKIQSVRVKQNISLPEAKNLVESRTPNSASGQSYANVTKIVEKKAPTKSIAIQTDLTWGPRESTYKIISGLFSSSSCQTDTDIVPREHSTLLSHTNKEEHLDNDISSAVSKVSGKHNPSTSTTKEDKPPVAKKPQPSGHTPKGSNDPIQLHNRYGSLMEADDIHISPTKTKTHSWWD